MFSKRWNKNERHIVSTTLIFWLSVKYVNNPKELIHLFYFDIEIWDALRNLVPFAQFKKPEKHQCRRLLLVKLQAKACNFTNNNTLPWVLCTFFKLHKWYQIAERITYVEQGTLFWNIQENTTYYLWIKIDSRERHFNITEPSFLHSLMDVRLS